MKKISVWLFMFAMLFSLSFSAAAQSQPDKKQQKAEKKEEKAATKGKAMSLTGWVKTEGDKTVFVNDKDKQTWNVKNPDVLKSHDGMHVKVKASLDEGDHSINVDSVKDLRSGKQSAQKQGKG